MHPEAEYDRRAFEEQVRPGLVGVTIAAMVAATELSRGRSCAPVLQDAETGKISLVS